MKKKPTSAAAPIIEAVMNANVRNPYDEHKLASEAKQDASLISASDIYLDTDQDNNMPM